MSNLTLTVIAINYYTVDRVKTFLQSFSRELASGAVHIIIVDNSESSDQLAQLEQLSRDHEQAVTIVDSGGNLGYLGGFAAGLRYCREHDVQTAPWIALSNVDLELVGTISNPLAALCGDRQIASAAPAIRSAKSDQGLNPYLLVRPASTRFRWLHRLSRFYWSYSLLTFASYAKSWFATSRTKPSDLVDFEGHQEIYASHGSFVILRDDIAREFIDSTTLPFLFGEEVLIAEFLRNRNLKTVFLPEIELVHDDHASTGWIKSRLMWREVRKSYVQSARLLEL